MAIKDLCFNQDHKHARLENNNWIILGFIWNNYDTFREFIQNNSTHFLSEVIPNNTETLRDIPQKTPFVNVHIK